MTVAAMRPWARVRAAATTLFAAHVARTALAVLIAEPLYARVARAVSQHPEGERALYEPGGVWLIEAVADAAPALTAWLRGAGLVLILAVAIGPLLERATLEALARPTRLPVAVAAASRGYFATVAVGLLVAPLALVGVLLIAVVPAGVAVALSGSPDERLRDAATIGGLVPGLLVLAVWGAAHDLSRAALVRDGDHPLRALRRGLAAVGRGGLARYLLWLLGACLAAVAAHALPAALDGPTASAPALVLVVGQAVALLPPLVRARWLASAIDQTR